VCTTTLWLEHGVSTRLGIVVSLVELKLLKSTTSVSINSLLNVLRLAHSLTELTIWVCVYSLIGPETGEDKMANGFMSQQLI
jgi:hypothetical protein